MVKTLMILIMTARKMPFYIKTRYLNIKKIIHRSGINMDNKFIEIVR